MKKLSVILGALLVSMLMTFAGSAPSTFASNPACNTSGDGHSYVAVTSGTSSSDIGTGAWTTTWPSGYSIHDDGLNFSDEGQWLVSTTDDSGIEGGFYSGSGNNVAWTDGLLPYYTTDQGGDNEYDDAGNFLSYSTRIWINVTEAYGSSGSFVGVGSYDMYPDTQLGYALKVTNPVQNYSQGEVFDTTSYDVLMGGHTGSPGEPFTESWEDTSRDFSAWGYYSACQDTGYGFSGDNEADRANWGGKNT